MKRDQVLYRHEFERRLRIGFIGAGAHSFRNIYPAFQYAPIDLVAVCDLDQGRAEAYAEMFGASRSYGNHLAMLREQNLDAVFIVAGYDESGEVIATGLAEDCLNHGVHVWMEKPTASSLSAVHRLQERAAQADRIVMTGLKKMFTPAMEKVKSVITSSEFGEPSSISVRYPQNLPPLAARGDKKEMLWFLDHIYHPAAVLTYLMGPIDRMSYEWEPGTGASVSSFRFSSGAVGTLHLTAGQSGSSPLERVEVIGAGANIIVENGVRVTYYRPGADRGYGRNASFIVPDEVAPVIWEPEFSLGQLYNKNLFYLGYVSEVLDFCSSILEDVPLVKGTLADVAEIMRLYEAYQSTPPGEVRVLRETRDGE